MIGSMDLNASPQPEEDDENFEQHYEEYSAPERHTEHRNHAEHVESAVDIARRVLHSFFLNIYFQDAFLSALCCLLSIAHVLSADIRNLILG